MELLILLMPILGAIFINGYFNNKFKVVGYLILVLFFCIIAATLGTFFHSDTVISTCYIVAILSIFIIVVSILISLHREFKRIAQKESGEIELAPLQVSEASATADSGEDSVNAPTLSAEALASYSTQLKRLLKNCGIHHGIQFQTLIKKRGRDLEALNENDAKVVAILTELSKNGLIIRTIAELNDFFKKY